MVSIVVGLASAKVTALLLGPEGVGFMGLLQGLIGLVGLLAGLSVGAGLVRRGANILAGAGHEEFAALSRAAWLLFWALGLSAAALMVVFRAPISRLMLGGNEHAGSLVLMSVALLFNLASGLQTSLLNAHHRVGALARFGVLNSLFGTAGALVIIGLWQERGIGPAVLVGSVIGWAISTLLLRREVAPPSLRPSWALTRDAAWSLLRFGGPYTASLLVGTGIQFLFPALVLHALGTAEVGFYRAAMSVAGVYLGFLLIAMGQDYFPRISAVSDQPAELVRLVNQQYRLVMLLSVPLILLTLALAPYLVPLVYSPAFAPTVEVLEWHLIGDLFKFASWTMGFVILARSNSLKLFLVEALVGFNLLWTSWLGVRWLGLAGLGVAFLVTYVLHYLVVWVLVRRDIQLTLTSENRQLFLAAILAALVIRALPALGLIQFRTPIALALALLSGAMSAVTLYREVGGIKHVRAWLRGNAA